MRKKWNIWSTIRYEKCSAKHKKLDPTLGLKITTITVTTQKVHPISNRWEWFPVSQLYSVTSSSPSVIALNLMSLLCDCSVMTKQEVLRQKRFRIQQRVRPLDRFAFVSV
eukprot:PhF_6_TR1983/c0_g1_i2/m.3317